MHTFFFFQVTQPCFKPRPPHTLNPDDVIRNTIGHVGHPIYVVNEVLFIYHSLLTLHMCNIYIRYITNISDIKKVRFSNTSVKKTKRNKFVLPTFRSGYSDLLQGEK